MTVIIAGAGIGGLTLALMLHQRGIASAVYEAAPEVKPLGVGINALPHAIRELEGLGLLPQLDEIAIRTRSLTYMTHKGQMIWSEPRGQYAGHDVPQFSIHRGYLQSLLWNTAMERLPPGTLSPGHRVVDFAQDADGVDVRIGTEADTQHIRGACLVGADGIHSTLRAIMHPDAPGIRWTGIQMWRGAREWEKFDGGDAMVIAGNERTKIVLYPIAPGSTPSTVLMNWVVYSRVAVPDSLLPERESWSRRGRYEDIAPLIADFALDFIDIHALIRETSDIFLYPMCDRDPLPWWSRGRVTLLGDAAHPMYPVGSNGASQAIVDGRCLTDQLASQDVAQAFTLYEHERLPVTAGVVMSNRKGGPERMVDLVAQRAPDGFDRLEDVVSVEELQDISGSYSKLAGFHVGAPS
ncbi:flavin-dependent oxidoreductase [Acetobacter sp. TBRC 12305]|uniref:Flavin-dependent oxidoreductase n=1 Tax=Acetobacter garciniae TaxID=2817435 RepID=A0A939KQ94_9PROT|nr:flavin-dependent oxidoreductase [Acetobacter garciniae]MBO1325074.1 flavin-dependent oxidoreductase [Acetobacter garciniae]MBX0344955.1 flavin-dependent oxidoreductase [Acetobacter garciniae]